MKTLYRKSIVLCVSLAIMFLIVGTVAASDVIEIRGPVFTGSDIDNILDNPKYGDGTTTTIDATEFAAFYYDVKDKNTNIETYNSNDSDFETENGNDSDMP